MRLDQYLAGKADILSRAKAQKLIEAGLVKVAGKKCLKASRGIKSTDAVTYTLPELKAEPSASGVDLKLSILYEDDECLVIDKPAGIAVHPGSGMSADEITILDGIRFLFAKEGIPFSRSSVLVHRLDKETTGCLLIAKNEKAHMLLQKQFEDRTIDKMYLTLVAGVPSPAAAMIDAPIGRHTGDRTKMSIMQIGTSRIAKTTYRTLGSAQGVALLACELHTGRTHQIRVHMRSIGHPILGDEKYETTNSIEATARLQADFLCLHAWKLSFKSPTSKKNVSVVSEPKGEFKKLLQRLSLKIPKA